METVPYSPLQEAKYAEAVDLYCELMTHGRQSPRTHAPGAAPPVLTPVLARLILWRIRDAQRYVRSADSNSRRRAAADNTLHRHLLIDWWHDYAEPYWQERFERYSPPQVRGLQESAVQF